MSNPIGNIGQQQPLSLHNSLSGLSGSQSPDAKETFQSLLTQSLGQVNAMEQHSQMAIEEGLATGELSQVEVFSSVKKADLALRMMMQIRNKTLEAYNEIKQMRL